ncbi:MAG: RelA/SpoT family protein [Rikenellaceae bacterium]
MDSVDRLLTEVQGKFGSEAHDEVREAAELSIALLEDRKRYNGDLFAEHSIGVAMIVASEIGLGLDSIIASLLHDVARMGLIDGQEIRRRFGANVEEVLLGMNSISKVETNTDTRQAELFKELIVSLSSNPRVILIKMADRLEVMRSIDAFPPEKRAKKSWETLYIYSQIAHKLGLYNLKSEMEDVSLKYLEADDYIAIERKLKESKAERETFIKEFIDPITHALDKKGIKYTIKGRTKSIYSIWRKMQKQGVPFEDVYDVFAVRIVIDAPLEEEKSLCWYVYSVVTDFYKPNTKRMRDWIAIPKSNGYESLHTTVVTDEGRWVEVQIRTVRMDEIAEGGIAAHWRYKGVKEGDDNGKEWLEKIRGIIDSVDVSDGGIRFSSDIEQTTREIFAFTPNGDLRKLTKGATILDFAYDIHSDIGNSCVGGRINHKNVTIRDEIKSGDLVEILTSKNQIPRRDWLSIVKTSKAKGRIKAYLREQEMKEAIMGREELERKLKNWKINIDLEDCTNLLCKSFKIKSAVDVYDMIATGKLSLLDAKEVIINYINVKNGKVEDKVEVATKVSPVQETKANKDALIVGSNLSDVKYKFGKCCTPIFGDTIFGFVTVLNGITIHRVDCPNGKRLMKEYPYRVIEAQWQGEASRQSVARISITSDDVMGLEYSIKEVLSTLSVELRGISTEYGKDNVESVVTIAVSGRAIVDSVVYLLKQINGVKKVLIYK